MLVVFRLGINQVASFSIGIETIVRSFVPQPMEAKGKKCQTYSQSQYTDKGLRFILQQVTKSDFQIVCYHDPNVFSKLPKIVRSYIIYTTKIVPER